MTNGPARSGARRHPPGGDDLHGSVPENSPVALLLIDVINDMEFEGAEPLVRQAIPMARRLAALKQRAKAAGIPVLYINDNFGKWQSDFRKLVDHCLQDGVRGEEVARILAPEDDDYFVLKPKHSAFFETTLDTLLAYLGARTLILTGIAGNICLLFSANDAYMRGYRIVTPADCAVSNTPEENQHAFEQMRRVLKADTTPSADLDLDALLGEDTMADAADAGALTTDVSLVKFEDLKLLVTDTPLGDSSVSLKLAETTVSAPAHFGSALPVEFTFEAGAAFSVLALNGKSGADEAGIIGDADAKTADGSFAPLLKFSEGDAWLEYVVDGTVKAEVGAATGPIKFTGGAGATVRFARYVRHAPDINVATAIAADLGRPRLAVVRDHVANLAAGEALAFQTSGELVASVELEWGDVFTSEIGALARLLRTSSPIAIQTTMGATLSATVTVSDTFIVAFARASDGGPIRVGIKKGRVKQADVNAGVKMSAAVASDSLTAVLDDVVAGLLGTVASRLTTLLQNIANRATTAADNQLAAAIVDRLQLAGTGKIAEAVEQLKARTIGEVTKLVTSKVEAAFAYEYHRVDARTTVFEATIAADGLTADLHKALVGGDVARAFSMPPAALAVNKYLNERKTTMSRAWGFTLGIGKWSVFGRDRRELEVVTRVDELEQQSWRSYLGSGGYERTKLTWMADFKADMHAFSPQPRVDEFDFGLHLAFTRDTQPFGRANLETALDFAALWSICPEASLPFVRERLTAAVNQTAEWSFHVRVNDEALRPIARVLGSMTPRDFASAAAAAMDPARDTASVSLRRTRFAPLWQAVLQSADSFNLDTVRASADAALDDHALAFRERTAAEQRLATPTTVAGLVTVNPGTVDDCQRFARGCRLLADSIATKAVDEGVVKTVYRQLAGLWTQSHYLRMLGVLLVDAARATGQIKGVERTLNISAGGATIVISANDFANG